MKTEDITNWLSQLEPLAGSGSTALYPQPTDNNQHQPPSPPESRKRRQTMTDDSHPTPKRQRVEDNASDVDDTPRASSSRRGRGYLQTASPTTSLPAPSESQSGQSQTSGRSSPLKQISSMELYSDGFETRVLSLTTPALPPVLSQLLMELEKCSNGVGVISSDLQEEIKEQAKRDLSLHVFLDYMFAAPADRDQLGPTPSLDDVAYLVEEAAECQATTQSESGWNMMVHHPLLYKAIYGCRRRNQIVGFAPCTTAKIIREYLPTTSQAKMVDFCIYLMPETEQIALNATKSLRRALPCNVINHTDIVSLRNRPIAVSIETKRRGGVQPATAELQLGTWHAAQWKFLEDLVARSGGSFDGLPFLPAIIVEGHHWSFAATTREGQQTVLWLEKEFGSTSSLLGVYKAVWGLQRLAQWAREVYWPWFRRNALGILEG
ncbi:hypothetical protein FALCPG4_015580 [Fusarium falciforme]